MCQNDFLFYFLFFIFYERHYENALTNKKKKRH